MGRRLERTAQRREEVFPLALGNEALAAVVGLKFGVLQADEAWAPSRQYRLAVVLWLTSLPLSRAWAFARWICPF